MTMRLALPEEVLLSVEKPERYLGNEVNAVHKNAADTDIRFVMCFPDVYEIGMSHLGIQILYDMFNARPDTWCERVYSPWVDLDRVMRQKKIPLFALESQDPVRDFDFLGITLQYELCYANILQILDLSGIPLHARDRLYVGRTEPGSARCFFCGGEQGTAPDKAPLSVDEAGAVPDQGLSASMPDCGNTGISHGEGYGVLPLAQGAPIIIGGGPCAYNPEPIADFFDLFYIGEGETVYGELLDLYKDLKKQGASRLEFLRQAAMIPGIYCPMFYEPSYHEDGTLKSFEPVREGIPRRVKKQVVEDLDLSPFLTKPLVPFMQVTQDRVVLEVQRGCIRGCRFCQAGMIYRPTRTKSLETLKRNADQLLAATGHEEISLSSLSTSDYPELEGLVNYLIEKHGRTRNINISLPSLRIDAFSLDVMSKVQDVKKSSLTFAPEGGSQRMRDVINKGLTEDDILKGAADAFRGGWNKVKLYFMLGQPTETEEDRKDIARLAEKIAGLYYDTVPKERRNGKCMITISTSFFVPKPFTPFQWATMFTPEDYLTFARTVNEEVKASLNHKSIRYNWHEAYVTVLEGLLARGDRRVSKTIEAAYRKGALFDAWTEHWDWMRWVEAMEESGIDLYFYTRRQRGEDELLPWDFIDAGPSKKFLLDEWHRALRAQVTPNCHQTCSSCGAAKFGCGVCFNQEDGQKTLRAGTDREYISVGVTPASTGGGQQTSLSDGCQVSASLRSAQNECHWDAAPPTESSFRQDATSTQRKAAEAAARTGTSLPVSDLNFPVRACNPVPGIHAEDAS